MKIYLLLFLALALLGCEGQISTVSDLIENNGSENDTTSVNSTNSPSDSLLENITTKEEAEDSEYLAFLEGDDLSDREVLEAVKQRQKKVFVERSDVLNQIRDVLQIINSPSTNFEDRKFYEQVLGILNQRKSELTLEVTLLEEQIKYLERKIEADDDMELHVSQLEELKEEEQEYIDELEKISERIISLRQEWINGSIQDIDEYRSQLSKLESEEEETFDRLSDVREEIQDKEEAIEGVVSSAENESIEDTSDLLV